MITGVVVGVVVGVAYGWSLRYGLARALSAGGTRALVAMQVGSVARLAFAALAFALAKRLLPGMSMVWGLVAATAIILASIVMIARRGVKS